MRTRVVIGLAVAAAMLCASCSEDEPVAVSTTDGPGPAVECAGDGLLDCARASTIADVVPESSVAADGEPLVLGMINQENTPAGSFPELSAAVQAAVAFVNEHLGGVDGRPIEVEVCNTEFSAEGSTACAQRFVDAGVPAVLGGIDVFGNGIDTLADNGIPYVGGIPVSTQSMTLDNSFQWSGGTWGATVAFADYAVRELDVERVAIVYGEFGPVSEAAEYGGTVLERGGVSTRLIPYPIVATDLSSPLQAAAAHDPDAIFVLAADTGCKPAFDGLAALDLDVQAFYVGACAAPPIIESVDPEATEGAIFNVEGPVASEADNADYDFYAAVIERYGDGLDPVGAGTVTFRSFMNLYTVLRELGGDGIAADAIAEAFRSKVGAPSFNGHDYTCDGEQFGELTATCAPQQILARRTDGALEQIGTWIDVGAVYAG